jgi:hypothetical protein
MAVTYESLKELRKKIDDIDLTLNRRLVNAESNKTIHIHY